MSPSLTIPTSTLNTDATSNLHITGSSQKRPAASDNVQNHIQVTEVVELAPSPIRDSGIFRYEKRFRPVGLICLAS